MKYLKAIKLFFSIVFRNWYYEGIDEPHPFKYRISITTALKVAKGELS